MPTDCLEKLDQNRVKREGTSQAQRLTGALKPSFVEVDEHGVADWMVLARRYAKHVRFFDENNQVNGDWRAFFENDPSSMLALAAVQQVDFYKSNISQYFKILQDSDPGDAGIEDKMKLTFGHLFNAVGTLARQLDLLKDILPKELSLKGVLQNTIQSQLAPAFGRLIANFKAAQAETLVRQPANDAEKETWTILGAGIGDFEAIYQNHFSQDWYKHSGQPTWADFHQNIAADAGIFGGVLMTTAFEKLNYAGNHNLFTGIFDLFVKAYARTVAEAEKNLEKSLAERDDHEPHFALFLAFLRLLEFARDHANTLTARHLDFYYKQILQLKEKPAEPNHAHLVFQLAKHKESHLLKTGTHFKAGKDNGGKEVAYSLDRDFVANIAQVAELKSVHHSLAGNDPKLYAFPVANSDDGRGAELTSTDQQWPPFTPKIEDENLATVGFSIASHYLLLREGHRKIRLTLSFSNAAADSVSQRDFCRAFDFYLTGEKGWVPVKLDATIGQLSPAKANSFDVPLVLDGSQPPIVPLSAEVHGEELPAGLPTLRAVLRQDQPGLLRFRDFQKLNLIPAESKVAVCVGYKNFNDYRPDEAGTGLKNLSIATETGEAAPGKPFLPFGPVPEKGGFFIVGCDEVFQKKGAQFQFLVNWKGMLDWIGNIDFDWVNEFYPNIKIQTLQDGIWKKTTFEDYVPILEPQIVQDALDPATGEVQIFFGTRESVYFPAKKIELAEGHATDVHFDPKKYAVDSRNGYLKLSLLGDFGHRLYQLTLARYMLRLADPDFQEKSKTELAEEFYDFDPVTGEATPKEGNYDSHFVKIFSQAMPIEPYTPEIEALTLSYIAEVNLNEQHTRMEWITPFGYVSAGVESDTELSLLWEHNREGELYISIKKLKPPQNLSLLFQVAEGSANPTVKKPEDHVKWSYLAGNHWQDFDPGTEISDDTGQLTRSGIIRFAVPKDATTDGTLFLPPGCHWLRASVESLPDAVCKIITVTAQAARATFLDQENAVDFLAAQLPAGKIAKLVTPDAAVKKLEQPYPTFGGRPRETDEQFYTRVSERLRHKNRAISLWDYEHLVLEAFPHIYKVKCLNHTHFEPLENGGSHIYNELAPGHVTLVAIPNLHNHNAIDPLRPYTSLGDLDLIKKFLAGHVSCFVKLHVHNPIFETVRVDFRVKFFPGTDEAFHKELLQNELVRFLSPWAFGEGQEVSFGGKIYKSSLIDFVEEQTYVDYVTDFKLFHPGPDTDGPDLEEVEASTAISILVSAEAKDHTIEAIPAEETALQGEACRC